MIACSAGLFLTACATYDDEYAYSTTESSTVEEASGAETGWQAGAATRDQQQQYGSEQQQYSEQQSYSQAGQGQRQSGTELVIPLHEEQVNVGKRTVDAGTVTIRKIVTSETVNQPAELRKESLVIDREGAGAQFQGSASAQQQQQQGEQAQAEFAETEPAGAQPGARQQGSSQVSGNAFQEQTYTIQLREEQPVVEKNVVQTGQVVARKNAEMKRQNVQREIRREDVQIDRGANAQNVQLRGDFDSAGSIQEPSGAERPADQESSVEQRSTYRSETEVETEREYDQSPSQLRGDEYEDRSTLDDINQGSNTRGGRGRSAAFR